MFSYIVTIILGVVQGFAGIFPVSDFAHQLYSAELSNWKVINSTSPGRQFAFFNSGQHVTHYHWLNGGVILSTLVGTPMQRHV
jgi:undecaprenyl pyrophosphate phosphatase UppP